MQNFNDFQLHPDILKNIPYETPSPIQAQAIPHLLQKKDLLGIAQTGTGKTAAFSLPLLHHLMSASRERIPLTPKALILAPTRELATQILENIKTYSQDTAIKSGVIFGGVGQAAQINALRSKLDILVATTGRLLDLKNQGYLKLSGIEYLILDEADRMLDMGFIHDIKKIMKEIPRERQTLLFSATMPKEILSLAHDLLKNPVKVEVTPVSSTAQRVEQKIVFVQKAHKYQLLRSLLPQTELTLVFSKTKHGANKIHDYLSHFKIPSSVIHGNKSQSARTQALEDFKSGKTKVLIATDIAARGIDVDGVSHVINFDLPMDAESYVHRIGRTARAGREGIAISFCDETERDELAKIQKLIKLQLPTENFVGENEASVKMTKTKRFVDPRRKPEHRKPESQENKVGFRFRRKK